MPLLYQRVLQAGVQSAFQYHECQSVGVKALGGHQLDFSMCSELCRCCLQQWGLTISLWEATNSLGDSLGFLEDFKEPLWPTTWLIVACSQPWRLLEKNVQLELFLSHYLLIPFWFLSYDFYGMRFPYTFSWSLVLGVPPVLPIFLLFLRCFQG